MNSLEQLKQYSVVVVDTGDVTQIARYRPQDATTNPSLLLKVIQNDPNSKLIIGVLEDTRGYDFECNSSEEGKIRYAQDLLAVRVGKEILKLIPGRISTEVPARLSYDTTATINYAQKIIGMYKTEGVNPERVLIKIASTWEGIKAAEELEKSGIHCNLTLLFSLEQALACAQAGVTLISPFVGRIYDWHMKNEKKTAPFPAEEDPGVLSVRNIYRRLKAHNYRTEIMGASFRNVDEVIALAGCDLLTISPELLAQLEQMEREVPCILSPERIEETPRRIDATKFNTSLTLNAMAYEKLGEGIRKFDEDARKLEALLKEKL